VKRASSSSSAIRHTGSRSPPVRARALHDRSSATRICATTNAIELPCHLSAQDRQAYELRVTCMDESARCPARFPRGARQHAHRLACRPRVSGCRPSDIELPRDVEERCIALIASSVSLSAAST
jgi:hypothetical protein